MLTILKGLIKGAIISALAMFLMLMILLGILLGPLLIPVGIVLLVVGGLGILDYKVIIKPVISGIGSLFRAIVDAIRKVVSA